jgi:hypothetical protein
LALLVSGIGMHHHHPHRASSILTGICTIIFITGHRPQG